MGNKALIDDIFHKIKLKLCNEILHVNCDPSVIDDVQERIIKTLEEVRKLYEGK